MNKFIRFTLLGLPFVLSGCFEGNKTTAELCEENPGLQCNKLNVGDGQCRIERTDYIWHRYETLVNATDKKRIHEYALVHTYKKCLELASQITPIDQTELKQQRFQALLHSISELERIEKELGQSTSAQALYFLWTQTGDLNARRQFLQREGKPELDTADMQYALATFYTTRDQEKTLKLLTRALELTSPDDVNVDILTTLASTHQGLRNKKHAYVWAMVAKEFGAPLASASELNLMFGFDDTETQRLQDKADSIIDAIRSRNFRGSMMPAKL